MERTDLDQREMDAIWSRFSVQQGRTGRDRTFKSLAHPMAHWAGGCHVRPVEMRLLEAWRHPATPRDMSMMHGLHIEVVRFIADEMLMIGLMDDMEDGRFITNDEGIVHTRPSPDERAAMHALITSSTGALYFDEIQMRTQIKDHVAMTPVSLARASSGPPASSTRSSGFRSRHADQVTSPDRFIPSMPSFNESLIFFFRATSRSSEKGEAPSFAISRSSFAWRSDIALWRGLASICVPSPWLICPVCSEPGRPSRTIRPDARKRR